MRSGRIATPTGKSSNPSGAGPSLAAVQVGTLPTYLLTKSRLLPWGRSRHLLGYEKCQGIRYFLCFVKHLAYTVEIQSYAAASRKCNERSSPTGLRELLDQLEVGGDLRDHTVANLGGGLGKQMKNKPSEKLTLAGVKCDVHSNIQARSPAVECSFLILRDRKLLFESSFWQECIGVTVSLAFPPPLQTPS